MATTARGVAILKFGTYTIAGKIVNEGDDGVSGQKVVLDDEAGQNVTHISNFGLEGEVTVSVIPLAAATPPAVDDVITYNSREGVLRSINRITAKRQPEIWRLVIDFIPGIDYSA